MNVSSKMPLAAAKTIPDKYQYLSSIDIFNDFRDKNLVKLGRGKVVLTDLAALEELEADGP